MKKGIAGLLLALIFLVLVILIFFSLFSRTQEKAFAKIKEATPEKEKETISKLPVSENYFGKQLILLNEKEALTILSKAVLDCFEKCKEKKESLHCNYIEMSNNFVWVDAVKVDSGRAKSLGFNIKNFENPDIISCLGYNPKATCIKKAELTCSGSNVYIKSLEKKLPEEKFVSKQSFFGQKLVLVNEVQGLITIGKAVLDCFAQCQSKDKSLFCNYIEMSKEFLWVSDIVDFIDSDRAESLDFDIDPNFGDFRNPDGISALGPKPYFNAPYEEKSELCCNTDNVFLTKSGECMRRV